MFYYHDVSKFKIVLFLHLLILVMNFSNFSKNSFQLREDGSLPLDLWKTHSAKDTITLPRSDLIQHFANKLLQKAELNESEDHFTINKVTIEY